VFFNFPDSSSRKATASRSKSLFEVIFERRPFFLTFQPRPTVIDERSFFSLSRLIVWPLVRRSPSSFAPGKGGEERRLGRRPSPCLHRSTRATSSSAGRGWETLILVGKEISGELSDEMLEPPG